MNDLRKAAEQALEALEQDWDGWVDSPQGEAITALRAALAQPEQYAALNPLGGPATVFDAMADAIRAGDDYHATLRRYGFCDVKVLAEPEQEPFGYFRAEPFGWTDCAATDEGAIPLYTAPTPRKPLTDECMKLRALNAELVEALRELIEHTSWVCEDGYGDETDAAYDKARATLAKVEASK